MGDRYYYQWYISEREYDLPTGWQVFDREDLDLNGKPQGIALCSGKRKAMLIVEALNAQRS